MTESIGEQRRARAQGAKSRQLHAALVALDATVAGWANDFIFGQVWDGDELGFEGRMLVAISALAATGNVRQLRNYLHGALQMGFEVDQLRAALRMMVVYAGFPTALDALNELDQVAAHYPLGVGAPARGGQDADRQAR